MFSDPNVNVSKTFFHYINRLEKNYRSFFCLGDWRLCEFCKNKLFLLEMTDLISAGNLFRKPFCHSSITKQGVIHEMVQFFSEYSAMNIHRYSQMNTLNESFKRVLI